MLAGVEGEAERDNVEKSQNQIKKNYSDKISSVRHFIILASATLTLEKSVK